MARPADVDHEHPSTTTRVREQRIVGPAGAEDVHRTAWCTTRGQSVPVASCSSCAHRERVTIDPTGRRSVVVCAMPALEDHQAKTGLARLQAPVAALMTARVICVRAELSVRAVLMVLVEHGISGAPVVDAADQPVGMISFTDLLREQYDQIEDEEDELLPYFARGAVERNRAGPRSDAPAPLTAEDIMTPSVFTVREDAPAAHAMAMMAERAVHRLPVVSRDGALVGMLSSLDVIRWMTGGPPGREVGE